MTPYTLQDLQTTLKLLPEFIVVPSPQVGRDSIEIDFFCDCQDISKVCFSAVVELCRHEDGPIDDSSRCRHCAPAHLLLVAVVVQVVERPLCLGLTTPESVHQEVEADRLLRREPLLVLYYFGVVEPFFGVAVRFLEVPTFEEFDEVSFGVRRDDDIEIRGEASIES